MHAGVANPERERGNKKTMHNNIPCEIPTVEGAVIKIYVTVREGGRMPPPVYFINELIERSGLSHDKTCVLFS